MRSTIPLTQIQSDVLDFMVEFFKENDQLPPTSFIQTRFKWDSINTAHGHRMCLVRKGYIEVNFTQSKYRFTRRTKDLYGIARYNNSEKVK